jgi:SPP1 family predicted phage head-tail adaptor
MDAGQLNKKIYIQQQTQDQNEYGEQETIWTTIATVYAKIKPLVGKEFIAAQQISTNITHDITTRYLRCVKPKMRVLYNDRYFDILSVINPDEKREWLYLKCREVVL